MLKRTVTERAQESADNDLAEAKTRKKKIKKFILDFQDEINRITGGTEQLLEWLISANIDVSAQSLDLSYAGDKLTLEGIFRAFRKMGYKTDKRPGKTDSQFTCYWTHDESDMRIWLRFSSTVCRRVKIGTEMVEQDVYETRCG